VADIFKDSSSSIEMGPYTLIENSCYRFFENLSEFRAVLLRLIALNFFAADVAKRTPNANL
jgi:hypothetical protein